MRVPIAGEEDVMSKGQDQVQVALEICRNVSGGVRKLTAVEEEWKAEAARRLECVQEVLDGVMDKFFLRTKLCVPFTSRCEKEARRLEETLGGLEAGPSENAQQGFNSALDALEKSAKALEDRSAMRGMAIT